MSIFYVLFLESYLEQKLLSFEFLQIGIMLDPRLLQDHYLAPS